MKLKLNRLSKGRYQNRAGDILVTVENRGSFWIGIIEVYTHTTKDLLGNDVEMFDEMYYYNAGTKAEVSNALLGFINR